MGQKWFNNICWVCGYPNNILDKGWEMENSLSKYTKLVQKFIQLQ
uniref:Uncharacterized protein n=2 Tax=Vibrio parahaemolyticus TaxID=670 RepID=A0A077ER84_VIBPH|nr:hypothetical protein [Vibrio parahaemolyticus]AKC05678.1 hypothetical protein pVA1058 [Vibrio parahaemolyticus]AQZ36694.1 hypothetical protein [Vibrio parahaemolyticus v110]